MKKVHIQDMSIRVQSPSVWDGWIKDKMKRRIYPFLNVTFEAFLKIVGDQTCKNLSKGKSTFTLGSIRKQLLEPNNFDSRFKSQKKELESKVKPRDKINELNKWLHQKCPDNDFVEKVGNEYRLLILSIEGPSGKSKEFYSKKFRKTVENLVLYHKREKEEILHKGIRRIEDFLHRNDERYNEVVPLKSSGPMWVDFDKGKYLTERPEVSKIIDKLDRKGVVVIKGKPACGKSVVLRNVGYKLASDYNKKVCIVHLKKNKKPDVDEALKLKEGYLLIDDAHLNIGFICDLLDNTLNFKLLIAIRDIGRLLGGEISDKLEEIMNDAMSLEAKDAAKAIIEAYDSNVEKLPGEAKKKLEEYKDNLWLLTWALQTYREGGFVEKENVLKRIKEWMEIHLKNDYELENACNVFFLLSVFYRYENDIKREFLQVLEDEIKSRMKFPKNLNLDKVTRSLIEINEVVEEDGKLALHHTKLAELYLETIEKFDLAIGIRNYFNKEELMKEYSQIYDKEDLDLIENAVRSSSFLSVDDEREIRKVLEDITIRNLDGVRHWIATESYLRGTRWFVSQLARANPNITNELLDVVARKMEVEEHTEEIEWFVSWITKSNEDIGKELVAELDLTKLISKIELEEDIRKIGWLVSQILSADKDIARDLVGNINPNKLKRKIEKEEDIEKIGIFGFWIARANEDTARTLIDAFARKIETQTYIGNIGWFVSRIARGSEAIGEELVAKVDQDELKKKFDDEPDIWNIGWSVRLIKKANSDVCRKLMGELDINKLKRKIELEPEESNVKLCVDRITDTNNDFGKKLVKILDPNNAETEEIKHCIKELKRKYLKI